MSYVSTPYIGAAPNDGTGDALRDGGGAIVAALKALASTGWTGWPAQGVANAPPVSTPAHRELWICGPAPTGAWAGRANKLAQWVAKDDGLTESAAPLNRWEFYEDAPGTAVYRLDLQEFWFRDASGWRAWGSGAAVDTDDVVNASGVPGATATAAFNDLLARATAAAAALATKADLVAGTVPLAQIPILPQSRITDLVASLSDILSRLTTLETSGADSLDHVAVANAAARLALPTSAKNRLVTQADTLELWYIEGGSAPATPGNWVLLLSGVSGGAVDSVFGRTGAVTAQAGDYDAAQISAAPGSTAAGATAGAQIEGHEARIDAAETAIAAIPSGAGIHATSRTAVTSVAGTDFVPVEVGGAARKVTRDNLLTEAAHTRPLVYGGADVFANAFPAAGSKPGATAFRFMPASGPVTVTLGTLDVPATGLFTFQLLLIQPAGGGVTFNIAAGDGVTVKWSGGAAPTIDTTAGSEVIIVGQYDPARANYDLTALEAFA